MTINTAGLFGLGSEVAISTLRFGTPTAAIEDAYYNPYFGTRTIAGATTLSGASWIQIGTATAPAGVSTALSIAPIVAGNTDISNGTNDSTNVVDLTLNADSGVAAAQIHLQAFDATAGFSTPQSLQYTGANLANANLAGDENMAETSQGIYQGRLTLYSGLSSSAVKVWALVSAAVPTTESDWASATKSNSVNVDKVKPTVNTPAQYNSTANSVTVQFSEGMNATVLTTRRKQTYMHK